MNNGNPKMRQFEVGKNTKPPALDGSMFNDFFSR